MQYLSTQSIWHRSFLVTFIASSEVSGSDLGSEMDPEEGTWVFLQNNTPSTLLAVTVCFSAMRSLLSITFLLCLVWRRARAYDGVSSGIFGCAGGNMSRFAVGES